MGDSKTWDRDWDRDHGRGRGLSYFNKAVFGLSLTLTPQKNYLKKDIPQPRTQPQPDFFWYPIFVAELINLALHELHAKTSSIYEIAFIFYIMAPTFSIYSNS